MTHPVIAPKKLIEVALPLDDINEASAREKSIRHGHPSTLHLWWARRPLAAARAVIFAQLVNDPASLWEAQHPGETPNKQQKSAFTKRRNELFDLIRQLVKWENTTNETVLNKAREEIRKSWKEVCALNKHHPDAATLFDPDKMPGLHDPFAGGGTIPLEAQRLGLEAHASDLNPVAVLINKAMIEIPPKFAGQPPIGPLPPGEKQQEMPKAWPGATGLAEDVRRYGAWMRDEAFKRIGHLYPPVEITAEMANDRPDLKKYVGQKLTVIAWLWARTVRSPNPAFSHVHVPLVSSFVLAQKDGKEAWVEPVVEGESYRFVVRMGKPAKGAEDGTKLGRGASFRCLLSGAAIEPKHIYSEAKEGKLGSRMLAIVTEGDRSRVYVDPSSMHSDTASLALPAWRPEQKMPENPRWFSPPMYGLYEYADLFSARQLAALNAFSDLARDAAKQSIPTQNGSAHGEAETRDSTSRNLALTVYLSFAVSRMADRHSTLCRWDPNPSGYAPKIANTFGRQALPMVWDYAEGNPFSDSSGNLSDAVDWVAKVLEVALSPVQRGTSYQLDARNLKPHAPVYFSTDPPYYDNIGYADLSDYFYVWLRRTLTGHFPDLLSTLVTPKSDELIASPYRHGSRENAERFFLDGMTTAIRLLAAFSHPSAPVTIYYAFKQADSKREGSVSSTGWETFLSAVLKAGFALTGTWPMRTELSNRMVGSGTNALASSIVLVCRRRPDDAPTVSRREFLRELNAALPIALDEMTKGAGEDRSPVAPVDLSQAIIGPGMAIFSKYAAVLEADGKPMTVKTALQLINRFLAEDDFDADTQFCLHWFEQYGWSEGPYGEADVLARAKATAVGGLVEAGVLVSATGKARLRRGPEYPADWDPTKDDRIPVWEALHQLVRAFRTSGEHGAATLLGPLAGRSEAIRQLGYRLYTLCERRGMADEARGYNELVAAWAQVEAAAEKLPKTAAQLKLALE